MQIGQTVYCLATTSCIATPGVHDWVVISGRVISFDEDTVCICKVRALVGSTAEIDFADRNTTFDTREAAEAVCQERNAVLQKEAAEKAKGGS
ncbi:hypothetical protein LCGC14_0850990 [marine sediment metagenome]|uniref:Uncharacterized protein n=1 Tax=marine sediment metagenome TaxID=412755 RepID=A0A0F9PVN3_9ZZZZ